MICTRFRPLLNQTSSSRISTGRLLCAERSQRDFFHDPGQHRATASLVRLQGLEIVHIRVRSAVQRSAAVCQSLHLLGSWDRWESCAWTLLLQQSCRRGQPPWALWHNPSTPTFQVKRRRPRSAKIAPSDAHRQPRWCPTRALSVRAGCDAHLHLPQLGMPLGEPTTAGFGATAATERLNHMGAAGQQDLPPRDPRQEPTTDHHEHPH